MTKDTESRPCECLAMLIADAVIREEGTGKMSIIGTFNRVRASEYPCMHDRLHLYVAITDAIPGKHEGKVVFRYIDSEEGSPVLEAPAPVVISDRLDVHEMNFCFRQLPFPRPGSVEIAYYFDGVYVHSRRLTLTQENPGEAREG